MPRLSRRGPEGDSWSGSEVSFSLTRVAFCLWAEGEGDIQGAGVEQQDKGQLKCTSSSKNNNRKRLTPLNRSHHLRRPCGAYSCFLSLCNTELPSNPKHFQERFSSPFLSTGGTARTKLSPEVEQNQAQQWVKGGVEALQVEINIFMF